MPYNSVISSDDLSTLIPVEYATEIIKGAISQSVVLSLARRLRNMPTKTRSQPVLSALPIAYFVNGETGLKQTTEVNWDNVIITAEELAVIVPIPQTALDDASYPIWSEVKPLCQEAAGLVIDQAVLFGTGKPASWPTALITAAASAGNAVTRGTGLDLYDDLLGTAGVISKLEEDGFMASGHIGAIPMRSQFRACRDADGNPIFTRSPQEKTQYELDGEPIYFPQNGAMVAATCLLFAGAWRYLVFAWRQDINWKLADEAVIQDGSGNIVYNLFQQDMVALRMTMRLGFQLPNPINRIQPVEGSRYPFATLLPAS